MKFAGELNEKIENKVERALSLLQDQQAEFHEKDGKYFAMGIEMSAGEYNDFLAKFTAILDELNKNKTAELGEDQREERAAA